MSHFYLGIDVSKAKLDCALRLPSGKFRAKVIPNSLEGFTTLLTWLNTQKAESMQSAWKRPVFIGKTLLSIWQSPV